MAVATMELAEALQSLIDARLDTIDRMLVGRVPRGDRLAIVREVEGQVHDLLAERGDPERLGRDDVLAVLAGLDPPEAYLPEESGPALAGRRAAPTPRPASAPDRGRDGGRAGRAGGILGLCAIGLLLVGQMMALISLLTEECPELVYFGVLTSLALGLLIGLLAVTFSVYARLRGAWAIVGLVNGALSIVDATVAITCILLWA